MALHLALALLRQKMIGTPGLHFDAIFELD